MRRPNMLCVVMVALICCSPATLFAQAVITYADSSYPKTGSKPKSIAVKGSVGAEDGWTLKEVRMEFWETNINVGVVTIPFKDFKWPSDGTWGTFEQAMPKANTHYWVHVTATVTDGKVNRYVRTLAKEVKSNSD